MAKQIEWVVIQGLGNRDIGAIGFIGRKFAVVAAFYDDADGNQDGDVSVLEWLTSKLSPIKVDGYQVTEVAMAAKYDMRVLERDDSFAYEADRMFLNFASRRIADGVYAAYFSRGVSGLARPLAGRISSNIVAQFVIRKGMEKAVREVYDASFE